MVLFSFESITRSAGLEAINTSPVSDSARATHESFESHLQRATAPPPKASANSASRNDRPPEQPNSSSTETRRNESVGRDNDDRAEREDDRPVDNDASIKTTSEQSEERNDEEPERDDHTDAEAVVATTVAEQQVTVRQRELDATVDVDDEAGDANAKKVAELAIEEEPLDLDAPLSTDAEVPAGETGAAEGSEVSNDKTKGRAGQEAHAGITTVESREPGVANANAGKAVASELQADESQSVDSDQGEETSQANTTPKRRISREDASSNQTSGESQNASTKAVDSAVVNAASEVTTDENAEQRRNPKEAEITKAVGATATTDPTTTTPGTPSRFAQHLLARTADPNGRGLSISDADQSRFVDRVARAVQATGERGGTLRLRLSPPELGSMTLEIKVQGGSVTARIEADTPAARSLLLENLPILRERLAEQGMRVDQFDVDLTDRQPGGTPDGLQQNDRQQQQDQPQAERGSHEPEEAPRSQSPTTHTNGSGQLNIIV